MTLEANPTSVEATRFRGYRAAGVNRVSLGVQALDDAALKELGRLHTAQEALDAVAIARAAFERYSFDLIYARPRQTPQALGGGAQARHRRSGRASVALSAHHRAGDAVPHAARRRQARRSRTTTPRARSTTRRRRSARAPACRPTKSRTTRGRAPSAGTTWSTGARHEYAGIGPGAHGRLDIDGHRRATMTEKRPEAWLMRVESLGHGLVTDDLLTAEERADEFLLMGLRLAEGIDPARYAALAGRPLDPDAHRDAGGAGLRRARPRRLPAGHAGRASRCSTPWWPISRRDLPATCASGRKATAAAHLEPPAAARSLC